MSDQEQNIDAATPDSSSRRSVLRNVAAGLATTAGLSLAADSATAANGQQFSEEEREQALEGYRSRDAQEATLAEREDALAVLKDEGLLDTDSARDLLDAAERSDSSVSLELKPYRQVDGTPTAELLVRRQTEQGLLVFGVRPDADQQFATVTPESGDHWTIDDVTSSKPCQDCCGMSVCCNCECCNPCLCPPDCGGTCYIWCAPEDEFC